ncbi:MAG: hypothetical protein PHI41_10455 [Erysipelotrichaceae bacterium]|nr:hypothetical protein [Erysipelotrichaceae bacterium]MDD3809799.1 hypothetical protein [Erysipelotrichaceae bacterium]
MNQRQVATLNLRFNIEWYSAGHNCLIASAPVVKGGKAIYPLCW